MIDEKERIQAKGRALLKSWSEDWNKFIADAFGAKLDKEQQKIVTSVQFNPRTSVASGTARGKDYVTACISLSFLYMTPKWNKNGELVENTKVALTGPTGRQVKNIMMPEISRLFNKARKRGIDLPGVLTSGDIRTDDKEWFLTGFKADEHNHEAWTGFHAVNTLFAVTEATGISESIFEAIEGNLQGNSRLLLLFNPNTTIGYAARSQKGNRFSKHRLNSLDAPNVLAKRIIFPGQVDYEWVKDKLDIWCEKIPKSAATEQEDDFEFEGQWYRPNDSFRKKVLGRPPKVDESALIPEQWIDIAVERYLRYREGLVQVKLEPLVLGSDIAGMGRDDSVNCKRRGCLVEGWDSSNSGGVANHMESVGKIKHILDTNPDSKCAIDTIGEGAGAFSRLMELGYEISVHSCKYSESARDNYNQDLHDFTGELSFANMRAYLFWAVRDWLNPKNNTGAMLPVDEKFKEEATEIKWSFRSDGKVLIEKKEDIKERLGRSTDKFDALANTFFPMPIIYNVYSM